jgi:hypothetical protein
VDITLMDPFMFQLLHENADDFVGDTALFAR